MCVHFLFFRSRNPGCERPTNKRNIYNFKRICLAHHLEYKPARVVCVFAQHNTRQMREIINFPSRLLRFFVFRTTFSVCFLVGVILFSFILFWFDCVCCVRCLKESEKKVSRIQRELNKSAKQGGASDYCLAIGRLVYVRSCWIAYFMYMSRCGCLLHSGNCVVSRLLKLRATANNTTSE